MTSPVGRLFMLAKGVLVSPSNGHRLCWREILKFVKTCIQRWLDGDLASLWSEAVAGSQSLSKRLTSAIFATGGKKARNYVLKFVSCNMNNAVIHFLRIIRQKPFYCLMLYAV